MECLGTEESIHGLKQATVVFELRQAKTLPVLGTVSGSQLLGRAGIPWEDVFESPNMEIERWVSLVSGGENGFGREGFFKEPKLKVGMRVRGAEEVAKEKKRRFRKWSDECFDHCADHEVFALAAAMEFL